jgi:outer membrane immunogenic protein
VACPLRGSALRKGLRMTAGGARRRVLAAAAALAPCVVPVSAASADDMMFSPSPVRNWDGAYFGLNYGIAWAEARHDFPNFVSTNAFKQTGSLVGGTAGYLWQGGHWVIGLEGDLDWSKVEGKTEVNCPASCFSSLQALATLRSRIGFAWSDYLIYTGIGVASGLLHAGQPGYDARDWEPGWPIMIGVEGRFAANWSMKLEFVHVRVNDIFYRAPLNSQLHLIDVNQRDFNVIRFGLSYFPNWDLRTAMGR